MSNLFTSDDISDIFDIPNIQPNECGLLSPHLKVNLKNKSAIELPISPPSSDRVFSVLHSKYHGALHKLVSRRQSISRVSKFSSLRRRQSIGISKMLNDTLTIASTPLKLNAQNAEKLIPSISTIKRKSICTKKSRLPIKQCLINKKSSKHIKDIFASQFDMINGQESSYKSLVQASPLYMRPNSHSVEVHLMDSNNDEDLVSNNTSKTTSTTVNLIASAILDQRSNNRLSLGTRCGTSSIDRNRSRPLDVDVSSSSGATSSIISAQGKLTKKSFNFGSPKHHQSANKLRLSASTMALLSPKLMKSPRPSISAIISNQDHNSSQSSSPNIPITCSLQDFKLQPKSQPGSVAKPCSSALNELPLSTPSSSSRLDHLLRISTMDGMSGLHDTTKASDTPIQLSVDKMNALIGSMRKTITPFKHGKPAVFSPKTNVPFISRPTTPKTTGSHGGFDFGLGFSNNMSIKTVSPLTSKEGFIKEHHPSINDDDHCLSSIVQGSAICFSVVDNNNDNLEIPPTLTKKLFVSDGIYSPQRNDQVLDISQQSDEFYSPRQYATEDTDDISIDCDDDDDDTYADLINSSVYLSGPNIDDSLSEDLLFHETSAVSPKVRLSVITASSTTEQSGQQLIVHDTISPTLSNASSIDKKTSKSNGFQRYMKGTPVALRVRCEETEVEVGADDDNDSVILPVVAEASKEINSILCNKVLKSPTLESVSVSNLIRRFQMQKQQDNDSKPLHACGGKEIKPNLTASSTVARTACLRDKSSTGDQSTSISSPVTQQLALKEDSSLYLRSDVSSSSSIIIDPHGAASGIATPSSVLTQLPTQERVTRSKVRFVGVPLTPQSCQDSMKTTDSRDRGIETPYVSTVDVMTPVKGLLANGKPVSITRTRSSVRSQRREMIQVVSSSLSGDTDTTMVIDDHEEIKENIVDGCYNLISSSAASMTGTPLAESKLSTSKDNYRRRSIKPDDTPFTKSIKCLIDEVNISIKGGINAHPTNYAATQMVLNSMNKEGVDGNSTGMNKLIAATPQIKARRLDRKKHIDELVGTCNDLIHMIDASI